MHGIIANSRGVLARRSLSVESGTDQTAQIYGRPNGMHEVSEHCRGDGDRQTAALIYATRRSVGACVFMKQAREKKRHREGGFCWCFARLGQAWPAGRSAAAVTARARHL